MDVSLDPETIARVLIGFLLAFALGLERQLHRKPVGFGTFIFVGVGSTVLAILAVDLVPSAPLQLLGGAITGIGFLGAGALIRTQDRVFGFTTAAMIWGVAAFGLALGVGDYAVAFVFYGVLWAVVLSDRFLERHGIGAHARTIRLTMTDNVDMGMIQKLLHQEDARYERFQWDKDAHTIRLTALVRVHALEIGAFLERLERMEHIKAVEIE